MCGDEAVEAETQQVLGSFSSPSLTNLSVLALTAITVFLVWRSFGDSVRRKHESDSMDNIRQIPFPCETHRNRHPNPRLLDANDDIR